ncbi:hypothetical protein VST7929_03079 [Vibrio stylophorae]|uniref:YcxB-like C-terminal domain-containing protein n=1 Tax=Vibrio stylophorae TaxID=659351 RepID=A0ABN8DVT6_9VIBR|nr:hypothetical protein [Vibrio stylophorae]CAH0535509.1 hypothetical protein VST7929_03079 [Vibrio stylophorae]
MEIKVTWSQNEDYLNSFWKDFIKHRSKMRKWTIYLGMLIFIANISIYVYFINQNKPHQSILLFAVIGLLTIAWHFWDKFQWYNLMRNASSFNKQNILKFTSSSIFYDGPISKGEMSWEGIENIVLAANGMFLVLQKGLSIYIPKSAAASEQEYNSIFKMYESNA